MKIFSSLNSFFLSFILSSIFSVNAYSQNWAVEITSSSDTSYLLVVVTPTISSECTLFFDENPFSQNKKYDLLLYTDKDTLLYDENPMKKEIALNYKVQYFSYKVSLEDIKHYPSIAYFSSRNLGFLNLKETLFSLKKDQMVEVAFSNKSTSLKLHLQWLSEIKNQILTMPSAESIAVDQNISMFTNEQKNVSENLSKALHQFNYLSKPCKLFLFYNSFNPKCEGLSMDNKSILFLNEDKSSSKEAYKAIFHELLHFVSNSKVNTEEPTENASTSFLYEALPEYLSLKFMLKTNLVLEDDFLAILENKLRVGRNISYADLKHFSKEPFSLKNYQASFSKGVIVLFLIDVNVFSKSDGKYTFADVFLDKIPQIDTDIKQQIALSIAEVENDLLNSSIQFPMNKYLSKVALLYEKQKVRPSDNVPNEAIIKLENIDYNKQASIKQKELWSTFNKRF